MLKLCFIRITVFRHLVEYVHTPIQGTTVPGSRVVCEVRHTVRMGCGTLPTNFHEKSATYNYTITISRTTPENGMVCFSLRKGAFKTESTSSRVKVNQVVVLNCTYRYGTEV
jgi:hypothetical protein